jgi:hypothetical protein
MSTRILNNDCDSSRRTKYLTSGDLSILQSQFESSSNQKITIYLLRNDTVRFAVDFDNTGILYKYQVGSGSWVNIMRINKSY